MNTKIFRRLSYLLFLFLPPVANNPVWAALEETSHVKKTVAAFAVGTMALVSERDRNSSQEIVIENRKGETFTFHGDGTVSVTGPFGEDLGTHRTNNNNPLSYQNIELVREGNNSGVFVGLGLNGGCDRCGHDDCYDEQNCRYQISAASSFAVANLSGIDFDSMFQLAKKNQVSITSLSLNFKTAQLDLKFKDKENVYTVYKSGNVHLDVGDIDFDTSITVWSNGDVKFHIDALDKGLMFGDDFTVSYTVRDKKGGQILFRKNLGPYSMTAKERWITTISRTVEPYVAKKAGYFYVYLSIK